MFEFFGVSIPYLRMWEYCNIIMVHKLVNIVCIQNFKSQPLCNTVCIFMGLGALNSRAAPGSPHSSYATELTQFVFLPYFALTFAQNVEQPGWLTASIRSCTSCFFERVRQQVLQRELHWNLQMRRQSQKCFHELGRNDVLHANDVTGSLTLKLGSPCLQKKTSPADGMKSSSQSETSASSAENPLHEVSSRRSATVSSTTGPLLSAACKPSPSNNLAGDRSSLDTSVDRGKWSESDIFLTFHNYERNLWAGAVHLNPWNRQRSLFPTYPNHSVRIHWYFL